MAGLYPLSRMQQFDDDGILLAGARLFLFDGGTTTPRIGYKDSSLTSAHPNPIVADSAARLPLIYLDTGLYRQRLTTKTGTLIFDDDGIPVLTTASGGTGTSVDPDGLFKTRDVKVRFDDQPLAGYVRLNGRTIGSTSSGATERANADTQSLYEELWGFANVTVAAGKGATAAADFAANKALTLPDAAGRGLFGMDDLGAGARSRITSSTLAGATVVGAAGGLESFLIQQAAIPSYSLTGGSGTIAGTGTTSSDGLHTHTATVTDPGHHHVTERYSQNGNQSGGGINAGNLSDSFTAVATTGITVGNSTDGAHVHTVSVTGTASGVSILSGGSNAATYHLPPALLLMIYIRL